MLAPNFSLPDQDGNVHTLEGYRGKWVIVYFYPKDDTPGCTIQACSFRDTMQELSQHHIVVLGISKDSIVSHKKFANKYQLPFPLLSDTQTTVMQAYDVWKPKVFMGKSFLGVVRTTFLISPKGEIVKKYQDMKLETHAQDILNDIPR